MDDGKQKQEPSTEPTPVDLSIVANQNEENKKVLPVKPPTMLDTLLHEVCQPPETATTRYVKNQPYGQQLLNSSIMMEKFIRP